MLIAALARLTRGGGPLTVLDTHAGAGAYDLEGEAARRSGEAGAGVAKLMADETAPSAFHMLKALVRAENGEGAVRTYPGSPVVAVRALRPGDRYLGCELRREDQDALAAALKGRTPKGVQVESVLGDGYEALIAGRAGAERRLVLIDPPFERGDDYGRVLEALAADLARGGEATHLIWTPLKDLQTFDSFLGGLEAVGLKGGFAVETRLRPLDQPLKLNGCAMVVLGPPPLLKAVEAPAREAAEWIARQLGESGAQARVERLGPSQP